MLAQPKILQLLFFAATIFVRSITGDCGLSSLEDLSVPPDLQVDLEADQTISEGHLANFTCQDEAKYLEPDLQGNNTLTLACGPDDTFTIENWPMCVTKCLVESAADEKAYQSPEGDVLSVDESITYSCNDSEAEIGSSMANEIQLTCASNGSLIPSLAEIPACLIPKNCSTPLEANAESGLVYDNSTDEAPLAYRFGTYVCANDSLITDFGNTFEVLCQEDGTFATPDSWPTCREPLDCDDFVPYPSKESLLNDSTTVVEKEGQKAIYVCRDAPTFKVNGVEDTFSVTCGLNGTFPEDINWPKCRDPTIPTTTTTEKPKPKPCWCIGDQGKGADAQEKLANARDRTLFLLDNFCRNPDLEGNVFKYKTFTPASRKRCGNRYLDDFSMLLATYNNFQLAGNLDKFNYSLLNDLQGGHCFCESIDEPFKQAPHSIVFTIALKTEPWQWTFMKNTQTSYLTVPDSKMYLDYKQRIEKAIDYVFYQDLDKITALSDEQKTLLKGSYLRAQVVKFYKGNDIPMISYSNENVPNCNDCPKDWYSFNQHNIPLFRNEKPTTTTPPPSCLKSDADELVPEYLTSTNDTEDTDFISSGHVIEYQCSGANEVLFKSDGKLYGDKIELTCWNHLNFTGVPESWPECKEINDTCEILAPPDTSNFKPQPEDMENLKPNEILTYECADATHVLDTDENNNKINVTCKLQSSDTSPYYQVTMAIEDWPICQSAQDLAEAPSGEPESEDTGTGRKKRQIVPKTYQYINVVVDLQLMQYNEDIDEAIRITYDSFNETLEEGILLETNVDNCGNTTCRVHSMEMCDNSFFTSLPSNYMFQTATEEVLDISAYNFTNLTVQAGEFIELSCLENLNELFVRKPLKDRDTNEEEDLNTFMVFCMYPETEGEMGSFNLKSWEVPPCVPVCTEPLPEAPKDTLLTLKSVIPRTNPNQRRNITEYGREDSPMYSGDHLVYECPLNSSLGVYGGVDTEHDSFKCTDEGIYDAPGPRDVWPKCTPQQAMVVLAVEQMLGNFDQKISDRYKLIEYIRDDDEKEIIYFSSQYFAEVTLPVVSSLAVFIFCCCCCTRNNSLLCNMCESKV